MYKSDPDNSSLRSIIDLICDYCGKEFQREKKSNLKLRKIIAKDSCGDKKCTQLKKKEINQYLYGCDNIFQYKKDQIKKTNLKKYGNNCYFSSKDFKEKRNKTLLEKYSAASPLQNEKIKQKQINTCLKKYGETNFAKTLKFKNEHSGENHPMKNISLKKDIQERIIERYNCHFMKIPSVLDKKNKTCLRRYGVDHTSKLKSNREKAKKTTLERYSVNNYSQTSEFKEKYKKYFEENYNVPNPLCLKENRIYGKTQNEIMNWLNSFNMDFCSNYDVLDGKELDMYSDKLKLAIEYCGLFWHNESSPEPRMKNYHYDKYNKCLSKKIKLITIFEDEWKNKNKQCKNFLKSIINQYKNKIYARQCEIKEIPKKEFMLFFNENHIQGCNINSIVGFGLYYKNELIGCMSLGRHPRNSTIVLDRLCFKDDWKVVGGASRLLNYCKIWAKNKGLNYIITWSDNRWSEGNVYLKIGFSLDKHLAPDYSYVEIKKPYKRLSKISQRKSNNNCPIGITESNWTAKNGLSKIWDCGKKRWKLEI